MKKTINAKGFTLIEVLLAVILVGIAIASLVGANAAFTQANGAGANMSTAEFLIEQIRELTITLAVIDPQTGTGTFGAEEGSVANYDDLDDFDNVTFSPPIDATAATLSGFAAFSQQVTVQNVNASNFGQTVADHGSDFVKVTVSVSLNSREISSASWIRALY